MSKIIIRNFIKQYLFFLFITEVFRLFFFVVYFQKSAQAGISEVFFSFFYAFRLDHATVMYLMVIPFFLYFFYSIFRRKVFLTINKYYTYFISILVAIIEVSNIAIYNEWGIKLNYKAVGYLTEPLEALHSARFAVLLTGAFALVLVSLLLIYGVNKLKINIKEKPRFNIWFTLLWFFIAPIIIFISMRGGVQEIPISQSQSYHSKDNFINTASVNTSWNLFYSIRQNSLYMSENPFTFYSLSEAKKEVQILYDFPKEKGISLFTIEKPNIVLVFLESMSGDFVDELGSNLHITPGLSKLIKDGYLFTNHYASGMLSHQGISAVLSAFPSTPIASITKQPGKYGNLPCFVKDLKTEGYYSSFHFGGQLIYGNIKAYIYYNEFDQIIEGVDFDANIPEGSLGHHDEYLFTRLLADINESPQPFFAGAFTLSSHSPFDQPVNNYKDIGGNYKDMLNSVYYSVSCLFDFVEKAKLQTWYDSTLFIFVSDHSHPSPFEFPYYSKEVRKIPLIFYGNVLKEEYRGKTFDKIISQTDIAATLLSQLNLPHDKYVWSKDVFNPNAPEFAYYGYDNGFGWISPKGNYAYLMDGQIIEYQFETKSDSLSLIKTGKSFVETLYQQYLDY